MSVAVVRYGKGWVDQIEPGRPFRMIKGESLKDQTSRKKLREMGEFYTVEEVAKRFKVRALTIYDWIHKGDPRGRKLGHSRIGRHIRISESHIEEFIA